MLKIAIIYPTQLAHLLSLLFSYDLTEGFEVAQYYRVRHLDTGCQPRGETEKCPHAALQRSMSWPLEANACRVGFSVIVVVIYRAEQCVIGSALCLKQSVLGELQKTGPSAL